MQLAAIITLVLGKLVAAFVVIGILAAIAIPVFLSQRAKAAAVTIAQPQSIDGMELSLGSPDGVRMDEAMRQMAEDPRVRQATASIYEGEEGVLVISALRPSSTFSPGDPGQGSLECATTATDVQAVCYASHAGYFVQIIVRGQLADPNYVARVALESVVIPRAR